MATVKPFKGVRPVKDFEKIACPPYDVLNSEEARAMAKGNPLSFLHIDKPEIDLPEGTDPYSPAVYETEPKATDKTFNYAPFQGAENFYGTHHIGASTEQAQDAVAQRAVEIIDEYAKTGKFLFRVN